MTKIRSGYILGDFFFSNSSGHPGYERMQESLEKVFGDQVSHFCETYSRLVSINTLEA
jgi:hypothetical protein